MSKMNFLNPFFFFNFFLYIIYQMYIMSYIVNSFILYLYTHKPKKTRTFNDLNFEHTTFP